MSNQFRRQNIKTRGDNPHGHPKLRHVSKPQFHPVCLRGTYLPGRLNAVTAFRRERNTPSPHPCHEHFKTLPFLRRIFTQAGWCRAGTEGRHGNIRFQFRGVGALSRVLRCWARIGGNQRGAQTPRGFQWELRLTTSRRGRGVINGTLGDGRADDCRDRFRQNNLVLEFVASGVWNWHVRPFLGQRNASNHNQWFWTVIDR